ncbi:hypothetical protein BS17DRAFT_738391 [Gyrodon lividus]|nr:hypothetical protein BS17DRAFT_738391 [Gyrodon lividus]
MSEEAIKRYLRISEYGIVAATAMLAYDYCITIEYEVRWVWGTTWTPTRVHFMVSRYLPFIAVTLAIYSSRLGPGSAVDYCSPVGMTSMAVYYLCIILAEALLVLRTYAFWQRNKKLLVVMWTSGIICTIIGIVVAEAAYQAPTDPVLKALNCAGVQNGGIATALQFAFLILFEAGMLCLNLLAYRKMKLSSASGHIVHTLYRDGVLYMAAILLFSVVNVIVTLTASTEFTDILNSPQVIIHSVLASRIFFNLRETNYQEHQRTLPEMLSDFRAAVPKTVVSTSSDRVGYEPRRQVEGMRSFEEVI